MTTMGNRFRGRRLALGLLTAGMAATATADDSAFTSAAGVGVMTGAQIYSHICQGCHMPQGAGAVGAGHYPKLAGNPALVSWQYVALTVLGGKNGMPAFGLPPNEVLQTRAASLTDEQVADVVNYVRSSFGNKYKSNVTAKDVAKLPHPGTGAAPF
ncbi:MAG: cytochrome c [Pseudomonadota bacterium]|nr:cytochrome c [Pseudomonadota bacterium]